MFQISRRADYAVRIMIALASFYQKGEYVATQFVSEKTDVPKAFLHKIAGDLVRAQLARSQAGPAGGLSLARPAENINLRHILEAVEGPVCLNVCLLRPGECPRDRWCPAHTFWGELQTIVVQKLEEKTLAMLVQDSRALQDQPRRQIIPYLSID